MAAAQLTFFEHVSRCRDAACTGIAKHRCSRSTYPSRWLPSTTGPGIGRLATAIRAQRPGHTLISRNGTAHVVFTRGIPQQYHCSTGDQHGSGIHQHNVAPLDDPPTRHPWRTASGGPTQRTHRPDTLSRNSTCRSCTTLRSTMPHCRPAVAEGEG